jgi:hypothetical protein
MQRICIVTDRDTGRACGFAFVELPNDAEAAKPMRVSHRTKGVTQRQAIPAR